jgi:hypothetical protein
MQTISSLIDDLNRLCGQYIANERGFNDAKKIQGIFQRIKQDGYRFIVYQMKSRESEFELLPDRDEFDQLMPFDNLKTMDQASNPFFLLTDPLFREIILYDPDGKLAAFIK